MRLHMGNLYLFVMSPAAMLLFVDVTQQATGLGAEIEAQF
jgi:hypothetical protein